MIDQLFNNDMALLAGLKVNGKLPLDEGLANMLIQELLFKATAKSSVPKPKDDVKKVPPTGKETGGLPGPDPRELLKHLHKLELEMLEGKVMAHFEIKVENGE